MGTVPLKLNNTDNQKVFSGSQCHFYQGVADVIRKFANEHFSEQG